MPTLEFKGKQHIYAHHLTVPYRPLIADPKRSYPPPRDTNVRHSEASIPDGNLIIHGDNLLALKALLPRYAGRINCIYIDPPYNTGNEGWQYNDNVNSPLMQEWLAQAATVDNEDLERHDKWLCMMWPRLHLLDELLDDDGLIAVSIDDAELPKLRMMMDEVFDAERFIGVVSWQKRGGPPNDRPFGNVHEYVVIYGSEAGMSLRPRDDLESSFANPDADPKGPWRLVQLHANTKGGRWVESLYYAIVNPFTGTEHYPPPNRNWVHSAERVAEMIAAGQIIFDEAGKSLPRKKAYVSQVREGFTWPSVWQKDVHGDFPMNRNASAELAQLFGTDAVFDTPKPVGLVDRVLRMATRTDSIVLDSFAGSGTTGHATLALNRDDGGNRRFILVECEDYADTITAERVRRVIKGVPDARDQALREGLGGSFTYCTLGEPIDSEQMLSGESLPSYVDLASHLLHTAVGKSVRGDISQPEDGEPFHSEEDSDYYLLYRPDADWLRGPDAMFTTELAERIAQRERQAVVFAAGKYMSQRDLTPRKITFCQLPYELHRGG